jgi:hypothetical protein
MSWAIAGDSLEVIGLLILTFGTGAQAWANLAEFKSMRRTVSRVALEAFNDVVSEAVEKRSGFDPLGLALVFRFMSTSMPGKLAEIRARGENDAVELARFLRLAAIWTILMIGSAFALAAAAIQLALASV